MIETIVIVVVALIVAILAYAATRPNTFRTQRSITIAAPPDKVFPFINDFHKWTAWSPWEKLDLELKRTYSGASQGKGTTYAWEGNKNVGTGRMEVLESVPHSKILIKLDFVKPFEAHNHAEFTLTPHAGSTQVTWAMYGPQLFMMKVMGFFCNPEKMVGGQFEKGLTDLKALAEK
jgi:hypothetical protein